MEKYLNKGIKDVISEFPEVAGILNEYNIGCAPCNVGSCLLKDIVQIHNLSFDEERELMKRIAGVIYPGQNVKVPEIKRKPSSKSGEMKLSGLKARSFLSGIPESRFIPGLKAGVLKRRGMKYSPPIKKLVDEHILIKRWIALIPRVIEYLDIEPEGGKGLLINGIDFIRSYADKFHHAKEEEILFKYTDPDLDIIKVMLKDHETARAHVKALLKAIEENDRPGMIEHLNAYRELLSEHIKKEDEILYPWIDRNLSTRDVGELFVKFNDADRKIGEEVPEKYGKLVETAEERLEENPHIAEGKEVAI
ncbi:MAG: hemerythrin domain-containing protein [Candidatus Omnitrophica bacterium]|nr:hemerythrin domain-containing protein [Candidatus Omnitrophota bacterium]